MTEQKAIPNRRKKVVVISVLIIFMIIATALGKYFWSRFSEEISSFLQEHSTTTSAATIVNLQKTLTQKQGIIQELQNEVQKHYEVKPVDWKPIAVEHLVRMADLTLHTTGDVKTALAFLLAAKAYTDGPEALTINRTLNKDIVRLQNIPSVDVEELIFKIDMVSKQINTLIIMPTHITATQKEPTKAKVQQLQSTLNHFFASVLKALKDIVIIRHQDVEPILPPEQVMTLRFNIHAKLLQAELAVMQRQNKLYQTCLTQVIGLINKHFVLNNGDTDNILHMLKGLQQVDLQPSLPSLTESFVAIEKVIKIENIPVKKPSQSTIPQPQGAELL
jgi:uroporphyrin-III C-methyltransferase